MEVTETFIEYEKSMKYPKKNASESHDITAFEDAGYMFTDDDLIIDIDELDHDKIKNLLDTFNIKTQTVWTDRGVHLYFKKPTGFRGTQAICALGFKVEYKYKKRGVNSITIRRNGKTRKIENRNVREELPYFFKQVRGLKDAIPAYGAGDGRDNCLFAHRQKIKRVPNWKECLEWINFNLFSEPLGSEDMERLTREITNDSESTSEEAVIAEMIMRECKAIFYAEDLWLYDGEEWISDRNKINRVIYNYCVGQNTRFVDEVKKQLMYRTEYVESRTVFNIRLKNGILRKGRFFPVDTHEFSPYYIPINYDPKAEAVEQVENYLNHLTNNSDSYRNVILEMMAYTLVTDSEFKRSVGKFFIAVGSGGNGKGTLLQVIKSILNRKNCSTLSVDQITKEQYSNNLIGKLANLGDDIEDSAIDTNKMKVLKNISTCDDMALRKLFSNAVDVQLTTTLIFTSNHVLKSFEKGESYKRRVMWLPMYTTVKKKDPNFIGNLTNKKALNYWFKLIVEAYIRLYQQGEFTQSDIIDDFNQQYHRENDNTIEFCENTSEDLIEGSTLKDVYTDYEEFCMNNGYKPLSMKKLKEQIVNTYNLDTKVTTINRKSVRVFRKM